MPWKEVRNRLNHLLRSWAVYFAYGTRIMAYRAADNHVYTKVRGFLARRHNLRLMKQSGVGQLKKSC